MATDNWQVDCLYIVFKFNIYKYNFMYSRYHDKLPDPFNSYFVTNDNIPSYNTRSVSKIHIDFKRTNYRKFFLKYRGATIRNSLPTDLKIIKSYFAFKKALLLYIQKQSYQPGAGNG